MMEVNPKHQLQDLGEDFFFSFSFIPFFWVLLYVEGVFRSSRHDGATAGQPGINRYL